MQKIMLHLISEIASLMKNHVHDSFGCIHTACPQHARNFG